VRKGAGLLLMSLIILGYAGYRVYEAQNQRRTHRLQLREAALRNALATMRRAIDHFHDENERYPRSLDELVPKHLRGIPVDPVTGSKTTWRLTTEETVVPNADFTNATAPKAETYIIDVHSGAGAPYSGW
jgi:type II secretory pathway pseudopilin PulG